MIFHFAAYGFLKNQRYFEPFLYLAFMDKGLTFFEIGLLIGFRELTTNCFEIFSGILADLFSRRRLLQASFSAYSCSFILLAFSEHYGVLMAAMFLYGTADSFRTGTHKAMIFRWLENNGEESEKTKTYGFTRSWSKLGSAFAVVLGSSLVLYYDSFSVVFLGSIPPCILGILNLSFYPKNLEEETRQSSPTPFRTHLSETWLLVKHRKGFRGLFLEAAGFEGVFLTIKDYLQPLLKTTAVFWLSGIMALPMSATRASVFWIAPVYFFLFLASALASRLTYRFKNLYGSETTACRALWTMVFWLYLILWFGFIYSPLLAILVFVILNILQNLWRPLIISRFDTLGVSSQGATLLSLESQSRRITVVFAGPIIGWLIDHFSGPGGFYNFWPLAAFGSGVSLLFLLFYWKNQTDSTGPHEHSNCNKTKVVEL